MTQTCVTVVYYVIVVPNEVNCKVIQQDTTVSV